MLHIKIHWPIAVLSIFAFLELAFIIIIFSFPNPFLADAFDIKTVKPKDNFSIRNEITCTIVYTTHGSDKFGTKLPWYENKTFTLSGLDTDKPSMIVNGKKWNDLIKASVTEGHLLLQTPPSFGSDVISLMTDNGSFVRTITGIQAGNWEFHYAIAQKGHCE
jgi:hypothetical protein